MTSSAYWYILALEFLVGRAGEWLAFRWLGHPSFRVVPITGYCIVARLEGVDMYEQFGGLVDQETRRVTFKLFIPDGERAPFQYDGGGLPRIERVGVVGSFQDPAVGRWDVVNPAEMMPSDYHDPAGGPPKGTVYTLTTAPLPPGFYEYKYLVTFENGSSRYITDPCARYEGSKDQNSGFVVGGSLAVVQPIPKRLPLSKLMIYELMIDDFVAQIKDDGEAPLQAITDELDYLQRLGVNAIEFMPWTAWGYQGEPGQSFSWGYNPVQYFSVAYKYTLNPSTDVDKIVYLKQLINECHRRDIHVIMDGVFNHAEAWPPDRGFPYFWLYQDTADSPYVGNFAEHAFFQDLDYANRCTLEYIRDACIYWIEVFKIDGIRLDNTLGMYKAGDRGHGLPKLLSELRGYLSRASIENFTLTLEHSWDYGAIDVTNKVGATSCWLDPFRSNSMAFLGNRPQGIPQIEPQIMRILDSSRDFGSGRAPTTYIENHDHRRFMLKAGGRDFWYLTQPYVIALFTSPGAPLIYNGQEFGQANDMPEQGDGRVVPRPVEWNLLTSDPGPTIFDRYQQMLRIRRDHPGLQSPNFYPSGWDEGWTQLNAAGFGIDRTRNVVVYHRWGEDGSGRLERFYIALNFSAQDRRLVFDVPDAGPWENLLGGPRLNAVDGRLHVDVGGNWGAIYYQRY